MIQYHWVWYLIGFIICPRLTVMIWISLYFANILPLPLFIIGWFIALCPKIEVKK